MAVIEGETVGEDTWAAVDAALLAVTGTAFDRADDGVETARLDARRAFSSLVECLRRLPDGMAVDACVECEQLLASERLLAVARMAGSSGDVGIDRRRARNAMSNARLRQCSGRSVNRDARRAAAVAANEHLGQQLSNGSIAPDVIDALNNAADDETGQIPAVLIDAVAGIAPDQAARVVDEHLESQVDPADVEQQYQRQHLARRAYRYDVTATGGRPALAGIALEGPKADVARLWTQIELWANADYQAEGGRDRPASQHVSLDNRRFDVTVGALHGERGNSGAGRPTVIVTVEAESLFGDADAGLVANQLGAGPIPESMLDDYVRSGSIAAVLRDLNGSPLWFGRSRRRASDAQFLALAVRDRGCVLCRAGVQRCEAHHVMPWTAPAQGRTDIDQLALLCERCHRDLHHRNHTLNVETSIRGKRIWSTRPATPDETPAPRPQPTPRE